jgi:hypothetical protein
VPVDLLERVAEQIEREPERYEQRHWETQLESCGTAHCIGGWAMHFAGLRYVDDDHVVELNESVVVGEPHDVMAQLLNFTPSAAMALCHSDWEPRDGRDVVVVLRELAQLAREGVVVLDDVLAVSCDDVRADRASILRSARFAEQDLRDLSASR